MTTTLQIGVFGPRNQGKTVCMAAWQAMRSGDGISLKALDNATMTYLRPLAEGLTRGQYPPANPVNQPNVLRWEARVGGRAWQLECIDFAGELADPIRTLGRPELFQRRVEAWMNRCNALLIFIDSTSGHDIQYLDSLDRLFQEIRRQRTRHGDRRRVIAAVLTKGDALPGTTARTLPDKTTTEGLLSYHPLYARVQDHFRQLGNGVIHQTFLITAVGWQYSQLPESQRKLQPCNLFAPLHWVAENANHVVVQGRNRRRLVLVYAVAALLMFLSACWYVMHWSGEGLYKRFEELVKDHSAKEDARERLAFYDKRIGPRRFDSLWGLGEYRSKADRQADNDRQVVARLDAEAACVQLLKDDRALKQAGKDPARHQAVLDCLARHEQFAPASHVRQLIEIREVTRAAYHKERQAWNESRSMRLARPSDYATKKEKLAVYARRNDALNSQEADTLLKKLSQQEERDRQTYSALHQTVKASSSMAALPQIEAQIQAYLAIGGEHGAGMTDALKLYMERVALLKQPRDVTIIVKSIRIPSSFLNLTWTGPPVTSVTVSLGGQSYTTSKVRTTCYNQNYSATFHESLGPYRVVWGQNQSMTVAMKVHRDLFSEETAAATISDNVFILNQAHGIVSIKSVEIDVDCPDDRMPQLPAYGED